MLIHLDDSLCDELRRDADPAINFLEHLAWMRRSGQHFVTGSRPLLEMLKTHPDLSRLARSDYLHLFNDFSEQRALQAAFIRRLEIVANTLEATTREERGGRIYRLPLRQVASLEGKTILLGENQNDCKFMTTVGRVFCEGHRLRGVNIAADTWGGGGSTVSGQYVAIQSAQNRLCLCIVDSDQRWPDAPIGGTAWDAQKMDSSDKRMSELLILPVAETENLLTIKMLELIVDAVPPALLNLESCHPESLMYLDFKEGLRRREILERPDDHPFRLYWHPILARAGCDPIQATEHCSAGTALCLAHGKSTSQDCGCVLIKELGCRLIERALERLCNRRSPQEILNMFDAVRRTVWEDIGALVVAWCCAPHRSST